MFQSLLLKFDEMVKQNEVLVSRVNKLEEQIAALSPAQQRDEVSFPPEDALRESEERYKRRKFVIVSGLPGTPEERCAQDRGSVESLIRKTGVKNFEFKSVSRIGDVNSQGPRPRLLKIKCSSFEMKIALLRASRNLRKYRLQRCLHQSRFDKAAERGGQVFDISAQGPETSYIVKK